MHKRRILAFEVLYDDAAFLPSWTRLQANNFIWVPRAFSHRVLFFVTTTSSGGYGNLLYRRFHRDAVLSSQNFRILLVLRATYKRLIDSE